MNYPSIAILFWICIISLSCTKNMAYLDDQNTDSEMIRQFISDKSCLIVRVPVQSQKVRYLKSILDNKQISTKQRISIEKKLQLELNENKEFFNMLYVGFRDHFSLKKVYFIPDSSFKSYNVGQKNIFLNENAQLDPTISCSSSDYLMIIQGNSKEQLLLVNKNGNKLASPFPYKKNTFMAVFKKMVNRKKFIFNQIKWFDKKLLEMSPLLTSDNLKS